MKITIDGRKLEAKGEQSILEVARENNIYIPTLCFSEEIKPYGACRLCLVEIEKQGRKRLVTSCLYPVEEDLVVQTTTPRVKSTRQMIMKLLLARCPENKAIKNIAKELGVEETPFVLENNNCILCGLCTRACEEVVGSNAISLVNRGINREVAPPYYEASDICIGCGSCVYVCPVNAIKMEDTVDKRILTFPNAKVQKVEFKLKRCKKCGSYWAPEKQLAFISEKTALPIEIFELCPDCRD